MKFRQIASAVLAAGLLVGCSSQQGLQSPQLDDVPVPSGMRLQNGLNESHSYEASGFRHAALRYYGTVPVAEVADYMRQRMKLHDWELVSEEASEDRRELRFDRHPYETTCTIWRDANAVTRMEIRVDTGVAR